MTVVYLSDCLVPDSLSRTEGHRKLNIGRNEATVSRVIRDRI